MKIILPAYLHKHTHKHTVIKKVPVHEHPKKHIVIHKHNHNHKHKHDHGHKHGHKHKHKHGHKHDHKHKGHHAHKHKHGHKHKHNHKHKHYKGHGHGHAHHGHYGYNGWGQYRQEHDPVLSSYGVDPDLDSFENDEDLSRYKPARLRGLDVKSNFHDDDFLNPVVFDEDGYKTSKKSVRSEHVEIKELNPNSVYEGDKYIVRGAYKVQEGDPYTDTTTIKYETYDSPSGKAIAQFLTNFDGKYDNLFPYKKENENSENDETEEDGEKESSIGEEKVVDYEDDNARTGKIQYKNYEDYGDNTEAVNSYTASPKHGELKLIDGKNYADEIEKYILNQVYGP